MSKNSNTDFGNHSGIIEINDSELIKLVSAGYDAGYQCNNGDSCADSTCPIHNYRAPGSVTEGSA